MRVNLAPLISSNAFVGVPRALIEEARRRQRHRSQRRAILLLAAALLTLIGIRVDRLVQAGESAMPAPRPALVSVPRPRVIYERIETVETVPHIPVLRRTAEIWSLSDDPTTFREVVTIAGGPKVEVGGGKGHDAVLGDEQVTYLYEDSTKTIYVTGFFPLPAWVSVGSRHWFEDLIGQPDVRLVGTTTIDGREANVIHEQPHLNGWSGNQTLLYIDKRTNVELMSVTTGDDLRIVTRTLVWKTLPATLANRDLTSLARAHRGVRVRPASPRIRQLYGQAIFPPAMHA